MFEIGAKSYRTEVKSQKPIFQNCANIRSLIEIQKNNMYQEYSKEKIEDLHNKDLIHYGKNKPYKKLYSADSRGVPIHNFWDDIHPITRREGRVYPTQKPINLLKRIIKTSCPPEGIMFDPFAGAGTTLSATIECGENRKCITSDISKESLDLIKNKYLLFNLDDKGNNIWKPDIEA